MKVHMLLVTSFVSTMVMSNVANAQSIDYSSWTLGELRSEITNALSELDGASFCYDSTPDVATVISNEHALDIILGLDISFKTPGVKSAIKTLQQKGSIGIYIERYEADTLISYVYVPYDVQLMGESGYLFRINEKHISSPGSEDEWTCIGCVKHTGFVITEEGDCGCSPSFVQLCGYNPQCSDIQDCKICLVGSNSTTSSINVCPNVSDSLFTDPSPIGPLQPGTSL